MSGFRHAPHFRAIATACILSIYLLYLWAPDLFLHETHSKTRGNVQFAFPDEDQRGKLNGGDARKADRVVETMKRTFWKYRIRSWGFDDIKPVSGGQGTSRNGWGAFIVDTSTTLALMGMWEELRLEVDHITDKIDFTTAEGGVNTFETTIRYLGALVSLVELIDNEIVPPTVLSQGTRDRILAQAITLADKLGPSFSSPTGMPWPLMNFTTGFPYAEATEKWDSGRVVVFPAHAGSNYLEYKVLSHLSGNPLYINRATRSWATLVWNKYIEEWPGLVDAPIDLFNGAPADKQRGWDRKHDSYYEYLLKAYILDPGDRYAAEYRDRWVQAVQSLRNNLVFESRPLPGQQVGVLSIATYQNGWFINEMSHLACFAPGNILLGGRYLGREDFITLGLGLLDGCHHIYDSTPLKIGPEAFSFMPSNTSGKYYSYEPSSEKEREQLEKYGFWIVNPAYRLRPEYIESLFYAYRITGDRKYQSWAWDAFTAIENATQTEFGFAQVKNVMAEFKKGNSENLDDECQSFWGAETLKLEAKHPGNEHSTSRAPLPGSNRGLAPSREVTDSRVISASNSPLYPLLNVMPITRSQAMDAAVKTFFSSPRFAVVGASQDPTKFGHKVFAWYLDHSLLATPINPRAASITISSTAHPTAPSVSALPSPEETSISIITPPSATLAVLREAKAAGVPAVWLQPGSFDDEGLAYAKREFKAGIGGAGGMGEEGWCVLVDGEEGMRVAKQDLAEKL